MNKTESNPPTQKDPKPFHYKYARPIVAIDLCCIGISKESLQEWKGSASKLGEEKPKNRLVVFIQRKDEEEPWCLPGRFMNFASTPGDENPEDPNENKSGEEWRDTLDRVRERSWSSHSIIAGKVRDEPIGYKVPLNEDILYSVPPLDRKDRDHRWRIISLPRVTFVGNRVEPIRPELEHVARWVAIEELIEERAYSLGYDHVAIVKNALLQLRIEASTRPLGKGLVSDDNDFDLQELVEIYNVLFGKQFSKSNLKKQFEEKGLIQSNATSPLKKGQRRRAERFRFVDEVYKEFTEEPLKFSFLPRY